MIKKIFIIALIFLLAGLMVLIFFPTPTWVKYLKPKIEKVLSEKLDARVGISSVDVNLLTGTFRMRDLVVGQPQGFQGKALLLVDDVTFDFDPKKLLKKEIVVDEVFVGNGDLRIYRQEIEGRVTTNVEEIISRLKSNEVEKKEVGKESAEDDQAFVFELKEFMVLNFAVSFVDLSLKSPPELGFRIKRFSLKDFNSVFSGQREVISMRASFEDDASGVLALDGTSQLLANPLRIDLKLDFYDMELKSLNAFLDPAPIHLESGLAGMRVQLNIAGDRISANNRITVDDLDLRLNDNPYFEEKTLVGVTDFDFNLNYKKEEGQQWVQIPAFKAHELNVFIEKNDVDGVPQTSLDWVLAALSDHDKKEVENDPKAGAVGEAGAVENQFELWKFRLSDSRIAYRDNSGKASKEFLVQNMQFQFEDFYFPPKSKEDMQSLMVDGDFGHDPAGKLIVNGKTRLSQDDLYVDLDIQLSDNQLTDYNPFLESLPFKLSEGTLNLDSKVKVENLKLDSRSELKIMGMKTASSEGANIVEMAPYKPFLTILTSQPEIKLPIDVRGDLNDPGFDIAKLVGASIKNVLTGMVASGTLNVEDKLKSAILSGQNLSKKMGDEMQKDLVSRIEDLENEASVLGSVGQGVQGAGEKVTKGVVSGVKTSVKKTEDVGELLMDNVAGDVVKGTTEGVKEAASRVAGGIGAFRNLFGAEDGQGE